MAFRGYKFKFELYASHLNLNQLNQDIHFHDFTIVIYFDKNMIEEELFCYDDISTLVSEWLEQFQGRYLGDTELFSGMETTLESLGDMFYFKIKEKMDCIGCHLLRLEIFENPIRTYSVSEKILDRGVNQLSGLPYLNKIFTENPNISIDEIIKPADTYNTDIQEEVEEAPLGIIVAEKLVETNADREVNEGQILEEKAEHGIENILQENNENPKAKKRQAYDFPKFMKLILSVFILLTTSLTVMYVIKDSGMYPRGSDTLCHVYRADLLLESIQNGNWYPLYDKSWYNGVEIMRYWAPLPLYVLAFMQYIMNGAALEGYILFVGVIVFFGGCGWLFFGWKYNRMGFATFIGVIWFFLPENMRVLIMDGNLPRALISMLLPYLMYFIWNFLQEKRWSPILAIMPLTCIIVFCHVGIAAMVLVSVLIFVMVHAAYQKTILPQALLILGMTVSFALSGIWLIPSVKGGASSRGSAMNQVMKSFFQDGFQSLNPLDRMHGNLEVFYYGISVFVICVSGLLLGKKKTAPGFLAALIIFFCTTESIYSIFINLPFSQFLWMIRFIPFSLVFAMMSLFMWNDLKKWFLALMCIMLAVDIIPSNKFIYVEEPYQIKDVKEAQYKHADGMFLNQAKAITKQRLNLLDLSKYGAFAPYYVSGVAPKVSYTFGAGWEGAATATNIVQVNTAVSGGNYLYLFDRSLELGNDTVLICIDCLKNEKDIDQVIVAGERLGYEFRGQGDNSLLFHKDIGYGFGTISQYRNIAIGDSAKEIALLFPNFKEGDSSDLEDYTMEELKQYQKIYLSGFSYKDKSKAEQILNELANSGVKIYIDMNKVPTDKKTNRKELFGVSAQVISFQETYPELSYKDTVYHSREFSGDTAQTTDETITWNTVYLDGIQNVDGTCNLDGTELVYAGTMDNENIYFLGFNLLYHVQIKNDDEITALLKNIFEEDMNSIPERKIVPIDITYRADKIIIHSDNDNVNTTLSYIDIFHSDQQIREENNLLVVNKGTTTIYLKYPYFKEGMTLSIIGAIAMIFYLILSYRWYHRKLNLNPDE